jgi:hypothetical protein
LGKCWKILKTVKRLFLFLGGSRFVCPAKNMIGRGVIKVSQCHQAFHGYRLESPLISGIDGLADVQPLGDICLKKVSVVS